MSVQDKVEHILKNIHLLFSASKPFDQGGEWIIVEKKQVFELLEQLNLAIYEVMDQYEMTSQKHELAQRRCEKRGEEIIQKANRHADDIYAASIMYTDDAINRICHIMEDANESVQKIFRKMNTEMEQERERVRHNQLELTGQLQDFADTQKYIKIIEEINKKLERERLEEVTERKEKRIQNEGKSYSAVQPEVRVNQAYFERTGKSYGLTQPEINPRKEEEESLARVTGKEFAESLRRRAARSQEQNLEIEDMSRIIENVSQENALPEEPPEIRVDLDAEYFKWKEGNGTGEASVSGKKERKFLFGRKSNSQ
ncbi:hypothetical protein D3Z36_04395 [Lachnospiraceae bacterium]|nr:hypothetical protein [Lachnospiraceae bacterium]